jgi:NCAIR mutase (PurE)-related protein
MNEEELKQLFDSVLAGSTTVEQAVDTLVTSQSEDLGYANVDHGRLKRQGACEVIYGQNKTPEQILGILQAMEKRGSFNILVTRIPPEVNDYLSQSLPMNYSPSARLAVAFAKPTQAVGNIAVVCAGTSDIPVCEEAAITAETLGNHVTRIYDVGVAGIHRLLARLPELRAARVIVSVAGMEGALTSVVGGLVSCPVIGVPTSVGYGASFHGLSALLSMLNACASGVGVVNIDNGFGAGFLASRINHMEGLS